MFDDYCSLLVSLVCSVCCMTCRCLLILVRCVWSVGCCLVFREFACCLVSVVCCLRGCMISVCCVLLCVVSRVLLVV